MTRKKIIWRTLFNKPLKCGECGFKFFYKPFLQMRKLGEEKYKPLCDKCCEKRGGRVFINDIDIATGELGDTY